MRATGVERRAIATAWLLVLAWHALAAWVLLRASRIEPAPPPAPAMQVVYLPPPPSGIRRVQASPRRPQPARTSTPPAAVRAPATPQIITDEPEATRLQVQVLPPESSPHRFLEQGRTWAARQAGGLAGPAEPADPFARREARLPGAGGGRFRMRRQVSLADKVGAVGGYLFAPQGYDADPCPRNRANLRNLMTGGDSAALQQELEFERRHCRS